MGSMRAYRHVPVRPSRPQVGIILHIRGRGCHTRWRWFLAVVAAAGAALLVAAGTSAPVTLYRIPGPSGKWFNYTDRRPPPGVSYQEVGDYERTSRPVALVAGQRTIYVYYPQGEKHVGQGICEDVWYALRLCERAAGLPFAWPGDVKIYRVPEFEIGAVAQHRGREGILASGSHPYLMYHEIAHYWSNTDLYRERWQVEGFAELLAYVVGNRVNGLPSSETFRAWKFKGIRDYPDADFPLERWDFSQETTLAREQFAYGKAFAACSLLLDRVGLYRLQQVNRAIRRRDDPVNTRQYIDLIEQAADRVKVDELLSGWILAGPYWLNGRRVSLTDYVAYLEKRPPKIPARLDPSRPDGVDTTRPAPASTSRPIGYFVDEHGNPIPRSPMRP